VTQHGSVTTSIEREAAPGGGGEREETTLVGLTQILLSRKMKKNPHGQFSWYK
jgi:hypothetical protein